MGVDMDSDRIGRLQVLPEETKQAARLKLADSAVANCDREGLAEVLEMMGLKP